MVKQLADLKIEEHDRGKINFIMGKLENSTLLGFKQVKGPLLQTNSILDQKISTLEDLNQQHEQTIGSLKKNLDSVVKARDSELADFNTQKESLSTKIRRLS